MDGKSREQASESRVMATVRTWESRRPNQSLFPSTVRDSVECNCMIFKAKCSSSWASRKEFDEIADWATLPFRFCTRRRSERVRVQLVRSSLGTFSSVSAASSSTAASAANRQSPFPPPPREIKVITAAAVLDTGQTGAQPPPAPGLLSDPGVGVPPGPQPGPVGHCDSKAR